MHTLALGIPACLLFSAPLWQYWQLMARLSLAGVQRVVEQDGLLGLVVLHGFTTVHTDLKAQFQVMYSTTDQQ